MWNDWFDEDVTTTCLGDVLWYQWYFDANTKLLLLLPEPQYMPSDAQRLWLKILRACELTVWEDFFSGVSVHSIESHRMVLDPLGFKNLQEYYQPNFIWYIGEEQPWLPLDATPAFMMTQGYLEWSKNAQIKKQMWMNWLKIKKSVDFRL